jgi:hypothetical protein
MRNIKLNKILKNYFLLNFLLESGKLSPISSIKIILLGVILPALVVFGSYLDNTFWLSGNGKGLWQHYGVWSLFLTTPILLIIALNILNRFFLIIKNINNYITCLEMPLGLTRIINKQMKSISLKTKTKYILIFFGIIGFMSSIVNIYQTVEPIKYYGNDVFDSYKYFWGFLANKIFLTFIWTLIYPIVGFIVLHVSYSMVIILRYLYQNGILFVDFFHKDNCGGVSNFGYINNLIMGIYINIFFVVFCLFITHSNNYFTLMLSSVLLAGIMIIHNFLIVYYIQKFVKSEKEKLLKKINERLNEGINNLKAFHHGLLLLRNHIINVRPHPYTKIASVVKNLFRFFPPAVALLKLLFSP